MPPTPEIEPQVARTASERLRDAVLAIDPRATFELADTANPNRRYIGMVAAQADPGQPGFAQHEGQGRYVIHDFAAPENHNDAVVEVAYRGNDRIPAITINPRATDKDR